MQTILIMLMALAGSGGTAAFAQPQDYHLLSPNAKLLLLKASKDYDVDYRLLVAIALAESSGNPRAINAKTQDYGLMQINAKTAKAYGYKPQEMLDKHKSVKVAVKVLKYLKNRYAHKEVNWACRYNVGTAKNASSWNACAVYIEKLEKFGYSTLSRQIATNAN
jgi:soluble lytic murein transglycosylase-like protein